MKKRVIIFSTLILALFILIVACAPLTENQGALTGQAGAKGCTDRDGDGFGATGTRIATCLGSRTLFDCDDNNRKTYPAAQETCDRIDNNCVSGVDEGFNVLTDTQNCGGCRNSCAAGQRCTAGVCNYCGNGVRDTNVGEHCDGSVPAGRTCSDFGYEAGTLSCTSSCTFNYVSCTGGVSFAPTILWEYGVPYEWPVGRTDPVYFRIADLTAGKGLRMVPVRGGGSLSARLLRSNEGLISSWSFSEDRNYFYAASTDEQSNPLYLELDGSMNPDYLDRGRARLTIYPFTAYDINMVDAPSRLDGAISIQPGEYGNTNPTEDKPNLRLPSYIRDNADFFKISVLQGQQLSITVNPDDDNYVSITIYDDTEGQVRSHSEMSYGEIITTSYTSPRDQMLYFKITGTDYLGGVDYTLRVCVDQNCG